MNVEYKIIIKFFRFLIRIMNLLHNHLLMYNYLSIHQFLTF